MGPVPLQAAVAHLFYKGANVLEHLGSLLRRVGEEVFELGTRPPAQRTCGWAWV